MITAPRSSSTSGFRELHVVSAALSVQAATAIDSCRSMLTAYPETASYTLVVDRPSDAVWSPLLASAKVALVDENTVYPQTDWRRRYREMEPYSPGRSGWYYQQILKLAWVNATAVRLDRQQATTGAGLLIWDSDTRILCPLSFVDPRTGRTFSYFTPNFQEHHRPFYAINAQLTGTTIDARQPCSNIVQFSAFSVSEALAFAAFLGLDASAPDYAARLAEKIVGAIQAAGLTNAALFSEYELIGLFKKLRLGSPVRRIRFIRTNNRIPSDAQLALMRHCRIAHFTFEDRFDHSVRMSTTYLLAQIALQYLPVLQSLRQLLTRPAASGRSKPDA